MKTLRWLTLIGGILLIILGCLTFGFPEENLLAISLFICLAVLVYGIFEIAAYFSFPKPFRSAWLLVSGLLSVILGAWMLLSGDFAAITAFLPYLFAFWLIAYGVMQAVGAIDMKNWDAHGWGWSLALGVIGAILGFVLMLSPIISALALSYALAFTFIFRGIADIIFFFTTRRIDEG